MAKIKKPDGKDPGTVAGAKASAAAEFKSRAEKLGLGEESLARLFGVKIEAMKSWLDGIAAPGRNAFELLDVLEQLNEIPEGKYYIDMICAMEPDEGDIEEFMHAEHRLFSFDFNSGSNDDNGELPDYKNIIALLSKLPPRVVPQRLADIMAQRVREINKRRGGGR